MPELITTTLTIMRPGGDNEVQTIDLPEDPGYGRLKRVVDPFLHGGRMERVNVLVDGAYTDMFVDGIGIEKSLPRNDAATVIYRHNWLTHNPNDDPESLPAIYGPAVLFSRKVWF